MGPGPSFPHSMGSMGLPPASILQDSGEIPVVAAASASRMHRSAGIPKHHDVASASGRQPTRHHHPNPSTRHVPLPKTVYFGRWLRAPTSPICFGRWLRAPTSPMCFGRWLRAPTSPLLWTLAGLSAPTSPLLWTLAWLLVRSRRPREEEPPRATPPGDRSPDCNTFVTPRV